MTLSTEAPGMQSRTGVNALYFAAGLAFHALTSAKHKVQGYSSPTAFSAADWSKSIAHAEGIVDDYARHMALYRPGHGFEGLDVLELGPGATLATGVLMAGHGARSYMAIDAVPLARAVPPQFYDTLIEAQPSGGELRFRMRHAADEMAAGTDGTITYAVDGDFDVARASGGRSFDLIVSNAAFEHFDDIAGTIRSLAGIARPGAIFLALVDFQTHTRWLRERDPNNIYRIPSRLYRALHFVGQPNRRRPRDYLAALASSGWTAPEIRPVDTASPGYSAWSQHALSAEFQRPDAQMQILTGAVLAERPR